MKENKNNIRKVEIRKNEQFRRKKTMKNIIILFVFVIIAVLVIVFIGINLGGNNIIEEEIPSQSKVEESNNEIVIPFSDIGYEAKYYSYDSNGVEITFFIVEGEDGKFHSAFNACDVCYHAAKGYQQNGDVVECINCGLTFPIDDIGSSNTGGGCWPSYLPIGTEGENIIIKNSDLDNKRYMFE